MWGKIVDAPLPLQRFLYLHVAIYIYIYINFDANAFNFLLSTSLYFLIFYNNEKVQTLKS